MKSEVPAELPTMVRACSTDMSCSNIPMASCATELITTITDSLSGLSQATALWARPATGFQQANKDGS